MLAGSNWLKLNRIVFGIWFIRYAAYSMNLWDQFYGLELAARAPTKIIAMPVHQGYALKINLFIEWNNNKSYHRSCSLVPVPTNCLAATHVIETRSYGRQLIHLSHHMNAWKMSSISIFNACPAEIWLVMTAWLATPASQPVHPLLVGK